MRISLKFLLPTLLLPFFISAGGCGCGFDCNNSNNNNDPAALTLGFSDSIPENLEEVVIEVDAITFRRSGADDVVVETFTIDELDITDAETFQVYLLQYRGAKQLLVIEGLQLDTGSYQVLISMVVNDVNNSYVQGG